MVFSSADLRSSVVCVLAGALVDATGNYGAAFYSCAAGTGLSAICLALVGPARSGMCRRLRGREGGQNAEGENDQPDFLEVDLALEEDPALEVDPVLAVDPALEDSPLKQAAGQEAPV